MDVIECARLTDTKSTNTPFKSNAHYSLFGDVPLIDPTLYYTIVECLVYPTITRLDVAYAIHIYLLLESSASLNLPFGALCFSETNSASNPTNQKSTTGFCIFLDDFLISWKSKKHIVISRFSIKIKYHAMESTTTGIVWLH
ncbi:uncharacterized protein LOC111388136 [Olea europaea var. sylvestris]|uniref:uncharacterized protein LOC111388136 n=1 Tax=Olea europaea var. sylvestris TaxID=158386 RepID=UPI000C1D019A|nr:uncharacterized protein LOC111388136 [Olea europaea var. sylvestris]